MRLLLALLSWTAALPAQDLHFIPLWPDIKFDRPVALVYDPSPPKPLYVVEQGGKVWSVLKGQRSLFLDLSAKVRTENPEEGLLSLAFHPRLKRFYAIYSVQGAKPRRTRLSVFHGEPPREASLLEIEKPFGNHNGSTLAFGPDGFLYVSLGDGGGGGDPQNHAQDLGSPLGKILRLDVDAPLSYAIPPDNPFVGRNGARGEIWAYGLRNPWRMAFDPATGSLWAGDVGQDAREEVDIIKKGGNYGWNWREGTQAYRKDGPDPATFTEPVFDYGRKQGFCITGGLVGRGAAPAALKGRYIFADYGSRRVWSLDATKPGVDSLQEHGLAPDAVCSFGTDSAGRIYLVGYGGGVYRVE